MKEESARSTVGEHPAASGDPMNSGDPTEETHEFYNYNKYAVGLS